MEVDLVNDPLVYILWNLGSEAVEEYDQVVSSLMDFGFYTKNPYKLDLYLKNHKSPPTKPCIIEIPLLEHKLLPLLHRYIILCENNTLSIIVADDLLLWQVENLKSIVKKFIRAIEWTITDIIRIDPRIFSHKIKLEVEHIPSMEYQRSLNPPI